MKQPRFINSRSSKGFEKNFLLALFPMKNSEEREVSFDASLSAAQDKHPPQSV